MTDQLYLNRRLTRQHGSALLIVFVFAAIVAIGLFAEMPIVIFEAQRDKEQLLIDRGNEYSQAVKLYLRKTGQYPANIDALENTNRVRFLRKKFKDPFTDKADWRLLHAGPNGILIDSKIKQVQNGVGANGALGTFNSNQQNNQSSPFGSGPGNTGFGSGFNNNSAFNNTGFGSAGGNTNTGFGAASAFNNQASPNRVPSNVAASNGADNPLFQGGVASNPEGIDPNQLPTQRTPQQVLNPDGSVYNPAGNTGAFNTGSFNNGASNNGTVNKGARTSFVPRSLYPNGTNGSAVGGVDPSQAPVQNQGAGGFGSPGNSQNAANTNNPNEAVSGLMSNPNQPTPQNSGFNNSTSAQNSAFGANSFGNSSTPGNSNSSSFGSSSFGATQNGSLAGVASKVQRHSIKAYNDQQDYSLWEFYYDLSKDPARNGAALMQNGSGAPSQMGNSMGQSASPFGQTRSTLGQQNSPNGSSPFGQSNSFGQSGGGNGGFGSFGSQPNSSNQNTQNQNTQSQNPNFGSQQPVVPPQTPPL